MNITPIDPRASTKYVPFGVLLDASGSMMLKVDSQLTRLQMAVKYLVKLLRQLSDDEMLAENVHPFIATFGGHGYNVIENGTRLADLDLRALEAGLAIEGYGNTPMGAAICSMLDALLAAKQNAARQGLDYVQPVLAIVSDSEVNDDMTLATQRCDALLPNDKLVLLPVGIGEAGTDFPSFKRLVQRGQGGEAVVLTGESDFKAFFRLVGRTVRAVEAGTYTVQGYDAFGARRVGR